jgi:hypothetical protein
MAHQNRGYQGPAFATSRAGRRPSYVIPNEDDNELDVENGDGFLHNRSNISAAESRLSAHNNRGILSESNISHRTNNTTGDRSMQRNKLHGKHGDHIAPLHDPAGKPLRRHGTETIGDLLLHPLKELQLHHKRFEAYEHEKKGWNEKHPESIASVEDIDKMEEPVM